MCIAERTSLNDFKAPFVGCIGCCYMRCNHYGEKIVAQMQLNDSRNKTLVQRMRFAVKVVYSYIPARIV